MKVHSAPFIEFYFSMLETIIVVISSILSLQGIITLTWTLYAWENPEEADRHKSPKDFLPPKFTFTALIPARNEAAVIADTIRAVNDIDYPEHLKEVLILCREDDAETIARAHEAVLSLKSTGRNIKILVFGDYPINKPHALNYGLARAEGEVIAVFDAEDEPHRDIYNIANTVLLSRSVDVLQCGIQLMNFRSHWFSMLNCMEYFFWFKSGLLFFVNIGHAAPLGGNTVFFKKGYLKLAGGWDEHCLTEDADIGIRLSYLGAKTAIVYDEEYVTREETPASLPDFIKQRTRWNQGFMQIFFKGHWLKLPKLSQKIIIAYVLTAPFMQAVLLLYFPVAILVALYVKMSVLVTIFSFAPFFLTIIQIAITIAGGYEFTRAYYGRFSLFMSVAIIVTFLPYQFILMLSSFRALYRYIFGLRGWEKTMHINAHRVSS